MVMTGIRPTVQAPMFSDPACAEPSVHPEWFFSADVKFPDWYVVDVAITICQSCIHKTDCLDYALRNKITYGIWGGLTAQERQLLRYKP